MNKEWLKPHEYAKLKNTKIQNVYRWIREGKIKDIKKVKIEVERIMIKNPNLQ